LSVVADEDVDAAKAVFRDDGDDEVFEETEHGIDICSPKWAARIYVNGVWPSPSPLRL
jgi:hypothetical protein